jgi:chromosome segregation ATPase
MQGVKTDMQDVKLRTASMENNLVYFGTRLQNLEEKVDQKLYDTRPIWQTVLERLDRVENSLAELKADMTIVKADVEMIKADMTIVKADVVTLKQTESELKKDLQEFKDAVLDGFLGVQKDINFYHRKAQMDVVSFAKDLALLETRLEKVESKLEIKN